MAAKYAINLKDTTIVYRSKATDAMPVLFRWIPDDVAKGIMEKRIDPKKVVNIIKKKVFQDENFDYREYEAELKKLNVVFKEEEVPEPEEVVDTTADNPADTVTMAELAGADDGEGKPAPAKKPAQRRNRADRPAPADDGEGKPAQEAPKAPEAPDAPADDGEENLDI